MSTIEDVIRFVDKRPGGGARVRFPLILGCTKCKGARGVNFDGEIIIDSDLAAKVELIQIGYNLAINESRANAGAFRKKNGHDGWPDDWQFVGSSEPCRCEAVELREVA